MKFYVVLICFTLLLIYLNWRIWRRTRDVAFMIGTFFLYYWTLAGGWFITIDGLNENVGMGWGLHYYYLFEKLFSISLDGHYFRALIFYGLFLTTVLVPPAFFAKRKEPSHAGSPVHVSHLMLILISLGSLALSALLIGREIITAINTDNSVYSVVRFTPNAWYTLHQLLNIAAIISTTIGMVVFLSGKKAVYLKGNRHGWIGISYVLLFLILGSYFMFIGSKNPQLFALISGTLFFWYNSGLKVYWIKGAVLVSLIATPLFLTDNIRGFAAGDFLKGEAFNKYILEPQEPSEQLEDVSVTPDNPSSLSMVLFSNEMFAAHMSMYGVLHNDLPFIWGKSLVSLAASIVPKAIWKERPEDAYQYYARGVNAFKKQGFTIHHASAWYLNFGLPGVLLGGILLGCIWIWIYNRSIGEVKNTFVRILVIIAPATFVATLPMLVRTGPEGYKSLFFESILLVTLVVFVSHQFSAQGKLKAFFNKSE